MNIRYRGKSEYTNNMRFAEIQYTPVEEDDITRFLLLMDKEKREYFHEDEVVTIKVDDKVDYEHVKEIFKAYKRRC